MTKRKIQIPWEDLYCDEAEVTAEGEERVIFDMVLDGRRVALPIPVEAFLNSVGIELIKTPPETLGSQEKTLNNSDIRGAHTQVPDLEVVGNGDMFKLLCKASSKKEGWMKSTKAMEIAGVGCVVQVTTQQGVHVAEAVTFVPRVTIVDDKNGGRCLRGLHEVAEDSL